MPIVNSTVLCILNFVKRVDLTTKMRSKNKEDTRELWEVLDMCFTWVLVMVSPVFFYVQIIQFVHVKYVPFFAYQVHMSNTVGKKQTNKKELKN